MVFLSIWLLPFHLYDNMNIKHQVIAAPVLPEWSDFVFSEGPLTFSVVKWSGYVTKRSAMTWCQRHTSSRWASSSTCLRSWMNSRMSRQASAMTSRLTRGKRTVVTLSVREFECCNYLALFWIYTKKVTLHDQYLAVGLSDYLQQEC